jgi:hypothetical protein
LDLYLPLRHNFVLSLMADLSRLTGVSSPGRLVRG